MMELKYRMPPIDNLLPSLLYAQNFPSLLVGRLLSPRPFDRVLDMCSAPGGKALHLAMLMNLQSEQSNKECETKEYILGGEVPQGVIIAMERSKTRALDLKETVKSMNLERRIHVIHADSAKSIFQANSQSSFSQLFLIQIEGGLFSIINERRKWLFFHSK